MNLKELKQNVNISTVINYLFVIYAFSIPVSGALTRYTFTAILILWIIEGNIKNKLIFAIKHKFIQAVLLFYAIQVIWLFNSENISFALATIKNSQFLLYTLIYVTSIKKEFIFKILNGFIYAMMFSEITSYLIHFQIISPINNATVQDPVPFALSHTTYSLYLGFSIGLMLYMSFNKKLSIILRATYILFFISASTNIFLIASRFGFILYSTSIIIVLLYTYKDRMKKIILISILLATIGYSLAYSYSNTFKNRINQTIQNTEKVVMNKDFGTSIGVRVGNWYYALKLIKENFIFGVGTGDQITKFKEIVKKEQDPYQTLLIANLRNGIHTELMDIFVQFGLIGFLIYLNIYYQIYKLKPKDDIFNILQKLLIIIFLLSAIQGGAIVLAVKDLGKLFTLLAVLIILNQKEERNFLIPKT